MKPPARILTESDLRALIPERDWTDWSHCMVFHGRYCCAARKPACERCPLTDVCPYFANQARAAMKSGRRVSGA